MDLLSANHAMINCSKKSVMLPLIPVKLVESICLLLNSIRVASSKSNSQGHVLLLASDVELEQVLDEILIVREYLDVFPDDIPDFPSEKEIEFSIELVPRTRPISIVPYRMSPMELTELKNPLKELLEKIVRPSA